MLLSLLFGVYKQDNCICCAVIRKLLLLQPGVHNFFIYWHKKFVLGLPVPGISQISIGCVTYLENRQLLSRRWWYWGRGCNAWSVCEYGVAASRRLSAEWTARKTHHFNRCCSHHYKGFTYVSFFSFILCGKLTFSFVALTLLYLWLKEHLPYKNNMCHLFILAVKELFWIVCCMHFIAACVVFMAVIILSI